MSRQYGQPQYPSYPTTTSAPQTLYQQPYNSGQPPRSGPPPSSTSSPAYPGSHGSWPSNYQQSPYPAQPTYNQSQQQYRSPPLQPQRQQCGPPPSQSSYTGQPYTLPQQQASYAQPYPNATAQGQLYSLYPPQGAHASGAPGYAPQGPPYGAAAPAPFTIEQQLATYRRLLATTVQDKQLQNIYPPDELENLLQTLAKTAPGSIQDLMREWRVSRETATDILKLALFDTVIYVDDSGSIEFEEGGERKTQLEQILGVIATAASKFDQDGISIRFMNSPERGDNICSVADARALVARVRFQGMTPMGTSLKTKVIDPMVVGPARAGRLPKPVLVITITDGQPAGEPSGSVAETIRYAVDELSRTQYGRGAISFQFAQVGNDLHAREFLGRLDQDPNIGPFVDCTSNFEVEQDEMSRANPPVHLTRELWCTKVMLGAIDPSYDMKDEKATGRTNAPPLSGQYGGYNQATYGLSQAAYSPNQGASPQTSGYAPQQSYGALPYGQHGYGQPYGGYSQPVVSQPPYGQPSHVGYPSQQMLYNTPPPSRRY